MEKKKNLPHALSVSWNSMQDRHQCAQAEERVPGNKMSTIAKHGAPEPRMSDDSLLGIQHESDEGEAEGADWDECYGVRISPNETANRLAPMISKFIRAQWESHELECMDDERRQLLGQRSLITYGVHGRRGRS